MAKEHHCPFCERTFATEWGVTRHILLSHPYASPGPRAKRARVAEEPPQCPAFDAGDWGDGDDGGVCGMDLPEQDMTEEQREALLATIRRQALELLTRPQWRQWAQDMLGWAEENLLSHMEDMFPEVGHFQTPETYRFLQLRSLHPGSAFAKELLKAAHDEALDLAKVCAAFLPHL